MQRQRKSKFNNLGLPLRVGLICAVLGMILAIVGMFRGNVPLNPPSIFLALLISGGSWGVVSWAVTTAVVDVESDAEAGESSGAEEDQQ